MTNLKETNMIDRDEIAGSNGRRFMWVIVSGLGIVITAGAVAGYLAAHEAHGGGAIGTSGILTLCAFATIIIGLSFAIWRNVRKMQASNEGLTRRDKAESQHDLRFCTGRWCNRSTPCVLRDNRWKFGHRTSAATRRQPNAASHRPDADLFLDSDYADHRLVLAQARNR